MQGSYELWLVWCSFVVAVIASYAALELAGRIIVSHGRATWAWLAGGSVAMGLGIWSMHFIGILAFHLPIPLTYDVPITLLSLVPAVLSSALVLGLVRSGSLSGYRLTGGAILLGSGIAAIHYTGMAAIPIQPAIRYDPTIFAASVAVAIAVALVVLKLASSLSGAASRWKKCGAALVMGGAICAMHYTGMAAAIYAPGSICTIAPGAIHDVWLAGIIAINTVIILLATVAAVFYDTRIADQNARTAQTLKSVNEALLERTRQAEIAEIERRESEARFQGLIALSSDWYWEQDENLRFTSMSGGVLKKLGWAPESFVGRSRWDFPIIVPDETLAAHKLLLVAHKDFHDFVYARREPDGKLAYVSVSGVPLFDDEGTFRGYRGIGRDVTDRVQAEQRLRDNEAKFRALIEQASDGIFILDAQGRFQLVNSRACELLGYIESDMIGMHCTATYREDERKHFEHRLRSLTEGKSLRFERMMQRKDGSVFPVDITARKVGDDSIQYIFRDISEQKRAEEALRDAHEKLSASVGVLERRNREIAVLSELSNFLLSCVTVEEACLAIPKFCETLFPSDQGMLFLSGDPPDQLALCASWGAAPMNVPAFAPQDCQALRQKRPYAMTDAQKDLVCGHVTERDKREPYLCVPLVMQMDVMGGLLWIGRTDRLPRGGDVVAWMNGRQQLAVSLAEQIAIVLSNIRLRENLRQQTIHDALTGLYNRRFLEESINREIARCRRSDKSFGVLMLDIDHFKRVNDTFGHDAGDSVLRSVAQSVQGHIRQADIACRVGGEEFIVVLPDTGHEGAATLAERILTVVRNVRITHSDKALGSITASIGLAMYPRNGKTSKALVESADKAMYEAKEAGRNRLVVASE